MVNKKNQSTNKGANKDNINSLPNPLDLNNPTDKKLNDELENYSSTLDKLKSIQSEKDITKDKGGRKALNEIYDYWVIILDENGKKINDDGFGVKKEKVNNIELLVRFETNSNGEKEIVFRELMPSPRFNVDTIKNNKKVIADELNRLKQIKRKISDYYFNKAGKDKLVEFNYDLTDVDLAILQKEIELNSIKYGTNFRYFHDIRSDGLETLLYEYSNGNLTLIKFVKEGKVLTQADENKKIEDTDNKNQIDNQLKKDNTRDYFKMFLVFMYVLGLAVLAFVIFEGLSYNEERENKEIIDKLETTTNQYVDSMRRVADTCNQQTNPITEQLQEYTRINQELLQRCSDRGFLTNTSRIQIND